MRNGFCTALIPTGFCIVYSIPQSITILVEDMWYFLADMWVELLTSGFNLFLGKSCYEPLSECTTRYVIICVVAPNTSKRNGCWNQVMVKHRGWSLVINTYLHLTILSGQDTYYHSLLLRWSYFLCQMIKPVNVTVRQRDYIWSYSFIFNN